MLNQMRAEQQVQQSIYPRHPQPVDSGRLRAIFQSIVDQGPDAAPAPFLAHITLHPPEALRIPDVQAQNIVEWLPLLLDPQNVSIFEEFCSALNRHTGEAANKQTYSIAEIIVGDAE